MTSEKAVGDFYVAVMAGIQERLSCSLESGLTEDEFRALEFELDLSFPPDLKSDRATD